MSELRFIDPVAQPGASTPAAHGLQRAEPCEECLGSGGWYRYEPALEPSPGLLYLSCLHCRGSGRSTAAQA